MLLMGGIVGRLFREFAVTLSVAIAHLGAGLADADADDVLRACCARSTGARTAASSARSSAASTRLRRGYDAALALGARAIRC